MSYRLVAMAAVVVGALLPLQVASPAFNASSAPTIAGIVTGGYHTCALTGAGGATCWGANEHGQLGNSTTATSSGPVNVSRLERGIAAMGLGWQHTCAITGVGGVTCWGNNDAGQLGDGTTTDSSVPIDVPGFASGAIAVGGGARHTCALSAGGEVTCWGENRVGQLGNPTATTSRPVAVAGLAEGVTAIAVGDYHTCALTSVGGVMCWGSNAGGELGDGTSTLSGIPVDVAGLTGVTAIAAGIQHTCALTNAGGVKCWGDTYGAKVGSGSGRPAPVDVFGLTSGIVAIAAGGDHTCALTTGGGVKCWGAIGNGQLGNGATTPASSPVDVSGLASGVRAIAAGEGHTCALMSGGGVKCWGYGVFGQLGDGSNTDSSVPVDVVFPAQAPPSTDALDPATRQGPVAPPLFPLLAGLAAGIAVLFRRPSRVQGRAHR